MIVIMMRQGLHLLFGNRSASPFLPRGVIVGFELLGNSDQVELEVIADEFADFRVFMISDQWFCLFGVGGVDVDVHGCGY